MPVKRTLNGLSYRKAQKRNSKIFTSLSKTKQKEIRQNGYKNLGWDNVCNSWAIMQNYISSVPVNLIDFAIKKAEVRYEKAKQSNDLLELLKAGKSVVSNLKMKYQ